METDSIIQRRSRLGDFGDCGNYAIALKRLYKVGKLIGAIDEGVLQHVFYEYDDILYDVYGMYSWEEAYDKCEEMWLYDCFQSIEDFILLDEKEIFSRLKDTSEIRIQKIISYLVDIFK